MTLAPSHRRVLRLSRQCIIGDSIRFTLSGRAAAVTLIVQLAKSPFVIHPMLEMPIRWAPLVGAMRRLAAIPIATMAVSVTEIAITTRFFNFHDRAVALKNTKSIVYRDGRRFRWNHVQQRKHHQPSS